MGAEGSLENLEGRLGVLGWIRKKVLDPKNIVIGALSCALMFQTVYMRNLSEQTDQLRERVSRVEEKAINNFSFATRNRKLIEKLTYSVNFLKGEDKVTRSDIDTLYDLSQKNRDKIGDLALSFCKYLTTKNGRDKGGRDNKVHIVFPGFYKVDWSQKKHLEKF